tara:strand:+ start:71 stop:418 length:348 start_codon:yes stop_codon:yes gene_type:complete
MVRRYIRKGGKSKTEKRTHKPLTSRRRRHKTRKRRARKYKIKSMKGGSRIVIDLKKKQVTERSLEGEGRKLVVNDGKLTDEIDLNDTIYKKPNSANGVGYTELKQVYDDYKANNK